MRDHHPIYIMNLIQLRKIWNEWCCYDEWCTICFVFVVASGSFDRVWLHGDLSTTPQQNIQTTTIPPGGCAIADWRHDTPGTFIFVDHAFVRGNIGIIIACDVNDNGCLSGESAGSYNRKCTCAPDRYVNNEDPLIDNDDFKYSKVYDETDEIYSYLDELCLKH